MKEKRTIAEILSSLPSTWTLDDNTLIALEIKNCPDDNDIKAKFLCLSPVYGQYCNKALYKSLSSLHSWFVVNYNAIYTLDEYIEAISSHIFFKSFIDWRPGDTLITYFKIVSLPKGPVGSDIRRQFYFIDAENIDAYSNNNDDALMSIEEGYEETEFNELIKGICRISNLSYEELQILLFFKNKHLTEEGVKEFNDFIGANYDCKQLTYLRNRLRKRIMRYKDQIRKWLS